MVSYDFDFVTTEIQLLRFFTDKFHSSEALASELDTLTLTCLLKIFYNSQCRGSYGGR